MFVLPLPLVVSQILLFLLALAALRREAPGAMLWGPVLRKAS